MREIFEQKRRFKEERNLKFAAMLKVLLPYICTLTSLFGAWGSVVVKALRY